MGHSDPPPRLIMLGYTRWSRSTVCRFKSYSLLKTGLPYGPWERISGHSHPGHSLAPSAVKQRSGILLTLYPDESGRFSVRHSNQRYRSPSGPVWPLMDVADSEAILHLRLSSTPGHLVQSAFMLLPKRATKHGTPEHDGVGKVQKVREEYSAFVLCQQGAIHPPMETGAFWPMYCKLQLARGGRGRNMPDV